MARRSALVALTLAATSLAAPAGAAVRIFPSDALTVRDPAQLTGRRVALPLPPCGARPSDCDELRRINRLDGFDVLPRVEVRFERAVRPARVNARTLWLREVAGGPRIGLEQLVHDPRTRTLTGTPARQLAPGTRYRISVARRLGGRAARATFTTMSATAQLQALAGRVRAARPTLTLTGSVPAGTPLRRLLDRGGAAPVEETVLDLTPPPSLSRYVFGTLAAPSWLNAHRAFETRPTRRAPRRRGTDTVSFALILPAGTPPVGGHPVAIFGHGFLRSHYDLFVAARENAARGVATIAIDAVGHGGGPRGAVLAGDQVIPAPGRSVDRDGDGVLSDLEGLRTAPQPAPGASLLLRDALRQTALDTVALTAALRAGVPGLGLSRTRIGYYGQSLGGIYGTMVAALEPRLTRSVLNVPGGPLVDIVRLAPGFRPLFDAELAARRPALAPAGATLDEQLPLRGEPPVMNPTRAALRAQAAIARIAWLTRSGSPEAYAPLLRPRRTLVQVAYGDETVPNPTSDRIVRAGDLASRTWVFRNDRLPAPAANPHGYLLDPTVPGQAQGLTFLQNGDVIDPDGAGSLFEPLRGNLLARLNF